MKDWSIPSSWRWANLAEVAADIPYAIVDGPFGSNLKNSDYVERGIPVLQGKNITNDEFRWTEIRYVSEVKAQQLRRSSVRPGDFLIVKIGSIGFCAPIDGLNGYEFAIIPANLAKITLDTSRMLPGFFHHWMRTQPVKDHLRGISSKTAQPALSLLKIREVPVPLPPPDEQRRIAAILDQADDLRRRRQEGLRQLGRLQTAVFSSLVCANESNQWPTRMIGEICDVKGGKRLPKGEEYSSSPTPFRYIRVSDLEDGNVREDNLVHLKPNTQKHIARYTVREGDIIISIAGSIGLIAPVTASLSGANLTENAAKLVPKSAGTYHPVFLSRLLQSKVVQDQVRSKTGQVTIGKLALFRIEQITISLPPIEVQRAFADRVAEIDKLKACYRAHLTKLNSLFMSLQIPAFQGKL